MANVRIISQRQLASLLDLHEVIKGVEDCYRWKAEDKTVTFPLVFHEFEGKDGDMDIKSGYLKPANIYGLKLVSFFGGNQDKSCLSGTIALFDDNDGYPLAFMEGTYITGLRTSAAAAIGAKYLARENSEHLLIVGAGHQCIYQAAAMVETMKQIKHVMIYDPMDEANAQKKASSLRKMIQDELAITIRDDIEIKAVNNLCEAVKLSDIIVTITPSKQPLIDQAWVKEGTHFSCVGSDMSGKQEIDAHILKEAIVYCDDLAQCIDVGEIEMGIKQGIIKEDDIAGEIGEVIAKQKVGRSDEKQITVFDTTGIAIQDLIAAKIAFDKAEKKNIGTIAEL